MRGRARQPGRNLTSLRSHQLKGILGILAPLAFDLPEARGGRRRQRRGATGPARTGGAAAGGLDASDVELLEEIDADICRSKGHTGQVNE